NVRIEVELALVLAQDLAGKQVTIFDVLRATEYVVPALEILSSRIELKGRTIVDTISDNAALGAMIYGGNPVRPHEVDLRWVSALLYRGEAIEESGVAAAVLNHPAAGVAWLAGKLADHGDQLHAGDIILDGSFTRPRWVQPGGTVLADYRELGTSSCSFVSQAIPCERPWRAGSATGHCPVWGSAPGLRRPPGSGTAPARRG